jgi:hypothetical protein
MTAFVIVATALILAAGWGEHLQRRYGQQVHPDGTIPQGFLTLAGWFLIALVAVVLLAVFA